MTKESLLFNETLVTNILAVAKAVQDFQFIHVYLGPEKLIKKSEKINVLSAYKFLKDTLEKINKISISEERKTYIIELIISVLTQVECFVFKQKNLCFSETVEKITGALLCPMFDIDQEIDKLTFFLKSIGYSSIFDFKEKKKKLRFENQKELNRYIVKLINDICRMTAEQYAACFTDDIKALFDKSRIEIEQAKGQPPCYYYYKGDYAGSVGASYQDIFSEVDLIGFVCHEVIPGHHFYYLLKQSSLDKKKTDLISGIDTFFSPENLLNEGIAVNADLIFADIIDENISAGMQIERLLHKIFYNCWYSVNIENEHIDPVYMMILRNEFRFSFEFIDTRISYFVNDSKYYTPCYPLGAFYVEKFISRFGLQGLPKLYRQQSVNSLHRICQE